jgi:serine O-acetyltransferase
MFERLRRDYEKHGRSLRDGGFWTLAVYRFGRWSLAQRSAPVRWTTSKVYGGLKSMCELATGVLLDRTTQVGEDLHIIHTGMISIHPEARLGNRVGLMHGVTIGTNMGPAVPVIGDDVFIGCNASVLGGVTVGDGARIAANSLVITDVPPGSVAIGVPAKVMPDLGLLAANRDRPSLFAAANKQMPAHTSKSELAGKHAPASDHAAPSKDDLEQSPSAHKPGNGISGD